MRQFFWGALGCVVLGFLLAVAPASGDGEGTTGVSEEAYADLMINEVLDVQDLAEGAEIQRRFFNRITPPNFSWLQPMFPSVAPFDAEYFDETFLEGLLGEDANSVAVYPLSLVLDSETRETLIYNAEGELVVSIPSDGVSRTWPEDSDPTRIVLQLDLLPVEDVEQYLYTEDRIEETLASAARGSKKPSKTSDLVMRSVVGTADFGILDFTRLTNGNFRLTVTNGTDVAEVFSYTVEHILTVTTNELVDTNGVTNIVTNVLWSPVSQPFNGLESEWECQTTNLVLTNGVGVWEDSSISSNDRVRFYGVAERADSDWDGLSDGEELFVYHTCPTNRDTDADGWSDAEELTEETDPLDRFSATRLAKGVVINEVLYNPDGNDDDKEWIELYSASQSPVELSGFSIQVASNDFYDAFEFPTNSWIQPGHCLLIGGASVSNCDHTASFDMPNCFTNEPTGAVRLVAEVSTNTVVADTLMYGGDPSVFNGNELDTTGWLSTNVPWASASNSVVRWFAGLDSDRRQDWTWSTTPTPTSSTNSLDSDGGGLTDQQELTGSENLFREPTNPHNSDSDGDGLGDYEECLTYDTDPNTWATDGDLFPWSPTNNYAVSNWWGSDSYEVANGWDPLVYDENTNGIPDSWEMAFPGTNLYADADGDGISNYDELMQNSNPYDDESVAPQPYVAVYASSKPGWINNGLIDVGLNGWVKIYFSGLKTNTCLGVWVKECSTQEEFKVEWFDATLNGSVWLDGDREVVTSASAEAYSHPYLLIQDLGWHPDYTATLGGEYTNSILNVELSIADPDDSGWPDLEEKQVILSDKDTRVKIKITPQLSSIQTIFGALGTALTIKTSGTDPNGQDFTMTSQNTTLTQAVDYSELRVALTRNQLISLGVLPSQESDAVTEKAWYDTGFDTTVSAPNLLDGEAFDDGMNLETRGKCTRAIYGGLESSPPNSPQDDSFLQSGGVEIILAEYFSRQSHKRQLMNQADYLYYSGHGYHASASLEAGAPSDLDAYWDKDLDVVVIAGCSVLDINDYNNNFTNPVEHVRSPGEDWEPLGPGYFLGYNYEAPTDLQNSDSIITDWCNNRESDGNIEAWGDANFNSNGRHACAIEAGEDYYYFNKVAPLIYIWTSVQKADW